MRILFAVFAVVAAGLLLAAQGAGAADSWGGSSSGGDTPLDQAGAKVDAGDYEGAIIALEQIVAGDPDNADAHNYLGYSNRKLGRVDDAMTHYMRALEIDPEHLGANEYLGELYLELGDLAAAEQRLEVLDDACGLFGCDEYDALEEKIEAYKQEHASR